MTDSHNNNLENNSIKITKLNRTFARRIGKSLNTSKKNMVEHELPKRSLKLIDISTKIAQHLDKGITMEIGFGMGEHFFNQIKKYPDKFFIGAEVYMNGVAELLEQVSALETEKKTPLNNFALWADDVDLLFEQIPNESLEKLYILFPDPWPKRRHHKKRLICEDRLPILKSALQKQGTLTFASDIDHYFDAVIELINNDNDLEFISTDFSVMHDDYVTTKYHRKAIREGRTPRFMRVFKKS